MGASHPAYYKVSNNKISNTWVVNIYNNLNKWYNFLIMGRIKKYKNKKEEKGEDDEKF